MYKKKTTRKFNSGVMDGTGAVDEVDWNWSTGWVDRWRMIVDLSFPHGNNANDGIPPELCSLAYASKDDAVKHILQLGRSTQLVKMDLKGAYRMVPVHPSPRSVSARNFMAKQDVYRSGPPVWPPVCTQAILCCCWCNRMGAPLPRGPLPTPLPW